MPCIIWPRYKDKRGYGYTWHKGKTAYAHRVAYEEAFGPIPEGMCVLHKCDNPSCVNIDHLFLGTNDDNVKDRNKKQRQAFGIKNGRTKLTEHSVMKIRSSSDTQEVLAEQYGISPSHVFRIKNRKVWKYLP